MAHRKLTMEKAREALRACLGWEGWSPLERYCSLRWLLHDGTKRTDRILQIVACEQEGTEV